MKFKLTYFVHVYNIILHSIAEHEKTGFIVLFMAHLNNTMKDIYFSSKKGAFMNITTSSRLDHSLKQQIDKMMTVPSSHHIIIPSAIELESFRKEVKSIFIETFDDMFVVMVLSEALQLFHYINWQPTTL